MVHPCDVGNAVRAVEAVERKHALRYDGTDFLSCRLLRGRAPAAPAVAVAFAAGTLADDAPDGEDEQG